MLDLKIGDEVYIHGFVDEVHRDIVIIKNEGGYFGTVTEEIMPSAQPELIEQGAYIRGFEQGRTQGMIDSQGGEEMNKQRKVLITITYNEMGIIIDTKAEEVAQPDLQQTCNKLTDACDAICTAPTIEERKTGKWLRTDKHDINGNTGWKCSCCGNITACNDVYCHACGAKMNERRTDA